MLLKLSMTCATTGSMMWWVRGNVARIWPMTFAMIQTVNPATIARVYLALEMQELRKQATTMNLHYWYWQSMILLSWEPQRSSTMVIAQAQVVVSTRIRTSGWGKSILTGRWRGITSMEIMRPALWSHTEHQSIFTRTTVLVAPRLPF